MLKIGMTACTAKDYGLEDVCRMIAEAGFDGVEAGINDVLPYHAVLGGQLPDACRDEQSLLAAAAPYRAAAEKYGLESYQAHAPFPVRTGNADCDAKLREILIWCVHACDALNCRMLVVHPVVGFPESPLSREEELEQTAALYMALLPAAKRYGVTVCTENMFITRKLSHQSKTFESICSDIPEACGMLDRLNAEAGEDRFGFCLDTGHLLLLGKDVDRAIRQLGSRLKALHIHDNNGGADQHFAPYMGIQDWKRFTDGLAASDYAGVLSFETLGIWSHVHPEMMPATLRYIAEAGRFFARSIEEKRKAANDPAAPQSRGDDL